MTPFKLVHIAAGFIEINGRTIQRCAVCGCKLVDDLHLMRPIGPDGEVQKTPIYPSLSMVLVERLGNGTRYEVIPTITREDGGNHIPEDFCLPFSDYMDSL